jgi:hypothetical protein
MCLNVFHIIICVLIYCGFIVSYSHVLYHSWTGVAIKHIGAWHSKTTYAEDSDGDVKDIETDHNEDAKC